MDEITRYDNAGVLPTGTCLVHKSTDGPEMVFSHSPLRDQIEKARRWIADHYDDEGEFHCPGDDQ